MRVMPDVNWRTQIMSFEMNAKTKHRIHGLVFGLSLASLASGQTQLFDVAGDKGYSVKGLRAAKNEQSPRIERQFQHMMTVPAKNAGHHLFFVWEATYPWNILK